MTRIVRVHTFSGKYHNLPGRLDYLKNAARQRVANDLAKNRLAMVGRFVTYGMWAEAENNHKVARRFWSATVELMVAAFRSIKAEHSPITFVFDSLEIQSTGYDVEVRPPSIQDWTDTLSLALCFRRAPAVAVLVETGPDVLELQKDHFSTTKLQAVTKYLRSDAGWKQDAEQTLVMLREGTISPAYARVVETQFEVMTSVQNRDQAAFTEAILEGLKAHKKYYARGSERKMVTSTLALWLAGWVAHGLEQGLEMEVSCGYLPEWLIRNETV